MYLENVEKYGSDNPDVKEMRRLLIKSLQDDKSSSVFTTVSSQV
jgi:aspartyl-tRNA synthetase